MVPKYKIHPAMGIARLGNSPTDFCIAAEKPASLPIECDGHGNTKVEDGKEQTITKFKDSKGRIKRQASRFHITVHDEGHPDGKLLKLGDPIEGGGNEGTLVGIQWRVYLANKKSAWYEFKELDGEHGYSPDHPWRNANIKGVDARQKLIIDPGPQSVDCQANFRLTGDGLKKLLKEGISAECVKKLESLKNRHYGSAKEFIMGAVGGAIAIKLTTPDKNKILKTALSDDRYTLSKEGLDDLLKGGVSEEIVNRLGCLVGKEFVKKDQFLGAIERAITIELTTEEKRKLLTVAIAGASAESGHATFNKGDNPEYAQTFPPPDIKPFAIETLGEIRTDQNGKLLVLGGHGNSGSWKAGLGEPRITSYANNDGWFDDTSDGPVMARLKMWCENIDNYRFIDVDAPSWVIAANPGYVAQILNIVTLDDVLQDLAIREFAEDPCLYGARGSFDAPQEVDSSDPGAVARWKTQTLVWNEDYYPGFYGEIWPILTRPQNYIYLTNALAQSNYPHDQTSRGTFYKGKLSHPETYEITRHSFVVLKQKNVPTELVDPVETKFKEEVGRDWLFTSKADFLKTIKDILEKDCKLEGKEDALHRGREQTIPYEEAFLKSAETNFRQYLYNVLREPGEENVFFEKGRPNSRTMNSPLMPLLCGDNPISDTLSSKFLRLTDKQLFILKQWAKGKFVNEGSEWGQIPDAFAQLTGSSLDHGALGNVLGGSFCPGGEVGWLVRNPSIYREPYRVKADPEFYNFRETAAMAYRNPDELSFAYYADTPLSLKSNFDKGLQPGDLTKAIALPWQGDFNECSVQPIDVSYQEWNRIYPKSESDSRLENSQRTWLTLWWPAHRPLQTNELVSVKARDGHTIKDPDWTKKEGTPHYDAMAEWTKGIPQTPQGDLKMVTAWKNLGFVVFNPYADPDNPYDPNGPPAFISVERNEEEDE